MLTTTEAQGAVMSLDDGVGDHQAKAETWDSGGGGLTYAEELRSEVRQRRGIDADPGVPHDEINTLVLAPQRQCDPASGRSELDCVGQQVVYHLH